jgi:hypothetical protein
MMLMGRSLKVFAFAVLSLACSCTGTPGGGNTNTNTNTNGDGNTNTNGNANMNGGGNGMTGGETLYAADGAGATPMLYSVNTTDATTTAIGAIGFPLSGMARADGGTMYGVTAEATPQLVTIDVTTGQATAVANVSNNPTAIEDLAYRNNQLYGWFVDANGPDYLVTIDTTSGASTRVGTQDIETTGGGLEFGGATDANLGFDLGFLSGSIDRNGGGVREDFTNIDFDNGTSADGDTMMGNTGSITALSHFMGRLYAVDGQGANGARLGTVDPTMGQFVLVGNLPDDINAIAGTMK